MRKLVCDLRECLAEKPEGFESRDWYQIGVVQGRSGPTNPMTWLNFCSIDCLQAAMATFELEHAFKAARS